MDFSYRVFGKVLEKNKQHPFLSFLEVDQEALFSLQEEGAGMQDSSSFRFQRRAYRLAELLIEEKGELRKDLLLSLLSQGGYIAYPQATSEGLWYQHISYVLTTLHKDPKIWEKIKRFSLPLCHSFAESLVRRATGISDEVSLSSRHVRVAVLSALLSYLRQNVGSCFATAPAIIIQNQQISYLLEDLYDLLTTGIIKRTFAGEEHSVPMSPSMGAGNVHRVFLLQNWEKVLVSPSLRKALSSAVVPLEKVGPLWNGKTGGITVEDFLVQTIRQFYGVTDKEYEAYQQTKQALGKGAKIGLLNNALPYKKMVLVEKIEALERQAKAVFQCFVDHPLLKVWEFTLASFSEVKKEFSSWNLYASLGMHSEEKGGIGEVVYNALGSQLAQSNEEVEKLQQEYLLAYDHVRMVESLLSRASNEEEGRRYQAELQVRVYHMQACQTARDKAHKRSEWYVSFFPFLMKKYEEKFLEYFQEIYDADMHDVRGDRYEDSPAGFRLVYKHGRSNASLWTMIYDAKQYIEVLYEFFLDMESLVAAEVEGEGAVECLRDVTTAIVSHIRTDVFLETALQRMAKLHGVAPAINPLRSMEKQEKKPWAYTSGGTMTTLLQTYYRREAPITEEGKWIENSMQLATFILDSLKTVPQEGGVLAASPSHAFVLHPSYPKVQEALQDSLFTYSWVRDHVLLPGKNFYEEKMLTEKEQHYLLEVWRSMLPPSYRASFVNISIQGAISSSAFRSLVVTDTQLEDRWDSFLYEMIPLTPVEDLQERVSRVIGTLPIDKRPLQMPEGPFPPFLGACQLQEVVHAALLLTCGAVLFPFDPHQKIVESMRACSFAVPSVLIFADTNWVGYHFAFLVNPGTCDLELWRVDPTGIKGTSMSSWKRWISGEDRQTWHVYTRPQEYS